MRARLRLCLILFTTLTVCLCVSCRVGTEGCDVKGWQKRSQESAQRRSYGLAQRTQGEISQLWTPLPVSGNALLSRVSLANASFSLFTLSRHTRTQTTIECYAGKQRAEEMENNMIRIITKLYFAVDTKQVAIKDLLPADRYLREALKQIR